MFGVKLRDGHSFYVANLDLTCHDFVYFFGGFSEEVYAIVSYHDTLLVESIANVTIKLHVTKLGRTFPLCPFRNMSEFRKPFLHH